MTKALKQLKDISLTYAFIAIVLYACTLGVWYAKVVDTKCAPVNTANGLLKYTVVGLHWVARSVGVLLSVVWFFMSLGIVFIESRGPENNAAMMIPAKELPAYQTALYLLLTVAFAAAPLALFFTLGLHNQPDGEERVCDVLGNKPSS